MLGASLLLGYTLHAQNVSMEWAKKFGGKTADIGNAIAVDAERNVYVVGSFTDTATFNTSADFISNGGNDMYIAKLDWSGATLWVKHFGGTGNDAVMDVKLDTLNNIYITGQFGGTVDFNAGGTPMELVATASTDIFVAKLDPTGTALWAKGMSGDLGENVGRALALDATGNVYTTGAFYGAVDFNPDPSTSFVLNGVSSEIFVSKLNNDGEFVWAKRMGGSRIDAGEDIAVDGAGHVYTTGSFQRTADFDPGTAVYNLISGANSYDVFVSKLSTDGDFIWAKQYKGSSPNMGNGLALDANANVYTTGMFTGTIDFDPDPSINFDLTALGGTDAYVTKLDSAGVLIWAKQMGGVSPFGGDRGYAISVDHLGNAYATGFFSGIADFDPGTASFELESIGSSDIYVSKLDVDGNFLWAKQLSGASAIDWGVDIKVDASCNVYSTGLFNGTVDFDPDPLATADLTSAGSTDAYVHKFMCTDTSSSILDITTGCLGYELNGMTYTTSGNYTATMPNAMGCDSIVTLNLTINLPEAIINVDEFTLGTTQSFTTYQWLLNGALINGAQQSTYTVLENGAYTVVVSDAFDCKDTSAVYVVDNVTSVSDLSAIGKNIRIYPNPATSKVYINSPVAVNLILTNIHGKRLSTVESGKELVISSFAAGLYFLQITDKSGKVIKIEKIIKQ